MTTLLCGSIHVLLNMSVLYHFKVQTCANHDFVFVLLKILQHRWEIDVVLQIFSL